MDKNGPVSIRFEFGDRETLMPLGDHAAHWANYLEEIVRELSLHHPFWRQVPQEQKARVMAKIRREGANETGGGSGCGGCGDDEPGDDEDGDEDREDEDDS
ncbi:hypothetical protein Tco_0301101 [Tanacetum coccineum]